jgi:hypothetical protein
MSTKTAIMATVAILLVFLAGGIIALSLMSGPRLQERAAMLGQGIGTLGAIICGVIWITWAAQNKKTKPKRRK